MLRVIPYVAFKGRCREAIEFYKNALGADALFTQTVGESPMSAIGPAANVMHCTLQVGDSRIMMCDDTRPETPAGSSNISLAVSLNDPERAKKVFVSLSQDGTVVMPLQKTYWAEAFGMITDKFGVNWMVNCEEPKLTG